MKNLVRVLVLALVMVAFVGFGKAYMLQKSHIDSNANQIVLVDFDDCGEPEYIAR